MAHERADSRAMDAHVLAKYTYKVPESAIDYNGHMNDAIYAKVISEANETALSALGMSSSYRERGASLYTVEMTIKFLREVRLHETLAAQTRLVSHDMKRLRLLTTLIGESGSAVATGDCLYLHVDAASGRVVEFPEDRMAQLRLVQARHDAVTGPDSV
jgi:acyl-CoA thioester hydrolase